MFEQVDKELEKAATLVANFYHSLIAKGVPELLACSLARDFFNYFILEDGEGKDG